MAHRFLSFFVMLATIAPISAQQLARFQARTDLVFLTVTVTDRNGRPVNGLESTDFRVYEDQFEQKIQYFDPSTAPVSIGLLLDRSGSMMYMIDEVYKAALHVVEGMGPQDDLFAMTFNREVTLAQGWTQNRRRVRRALKGLRAGGETALYDAVYQGIRFLDASAVMRKILCVVSDGADTASQMDFKELLQLAKESEVLIYPVGMLGKTPLINWGPFGNRHVRELKKLAEFTGGRAHFPSNVDECRRTMKDIAEELHAQYGVGYYPSRPLAEGGWRDVKVALAKGNRALRLRTRSGYQAIAPSSRDKSLLSVTTRQGHSRRGVVDRDASDPE